VVRTLQEGVDMTIRLTAVEQEMLKVLQQKDKRYKQGLEQKVRTELKLDYESML
jgi:hypothetical protein